MTVDETVAILQEQRRKLLEDFLHGFIKRRTARRLLQRINAKIERVAANGGL